MSNLEWLACIPDTHTTIGHTADALRGHCTWLAANYDKHNIVAVLHRGDFVNDGTVDAQWTRLGTLGFPVSGIPNIWCPGNHDVQDSSRTYTKFNATIGLGGMSALVGVYAEGSAANTYHLITIGGVQWLVLALEFDPPDAVVTWADGILATYSTTPAIVITHINLYRDGELTDKTKSTSVGGDQEYLILGMSGGDNYGQQLWDDCFEARGNVAMVLSGHDVWKGDGVRWGGHVYTPIERSPSAMFPTCHHILRNWQGHSLDCSGSQYMTLLGFNQAENKLQFREFSPPTMLDRFYAAACFEVDLVT